MLQILEIRSKTAQLHQKVPRIQQKQVAIVALQSHQPKVASLSPNVSFFSYGTQLSCIHTMSLTGFDRT